MKDTLTPPTTKVSIQGLTDNQVVVLDYSTRQYTVVTFEGHYPDDVEEKLYELGYDVSNCAWMT